MTRKRETNENYVHACDSELLIPNDFICSISQAGFETEEFFKIIEFYVLNAPILKSDKTDLFGQRSLKDYKWVGNSGLSKLERELLKKSGIQSFCFIKATSIKETLNQMLLGDGRWCVEHPRAILKQDFGINVMESGQAEVLSKETRMVCLFRHMRNAIAHNHIYIFDNGNMVLEDVDAQNNDITARILLKKSTLIDWITVVKKENSSKDELKTKEICNVEKAESIDIKIA